MKEFTIPHYVRIFFLAYGNNSRVLGRTGFRLDAGDRVLIGDPVTMTYDHQDMLAFPIECDGRKYFVLQEELQLPEFVEMASKVRERFEAQFDRDDNTPTPDVPVTTQHYVIVELPKEADGSLQSIAEAIANPKCRVVHVEGSDEEVYTRLVHFLDDLEKTEVLLALKKKIEEGGTTA